MKLLSNVLCIIYVLIALPAAAQKKSLTSPDGNILFFSGFVNKTMEYNVAFKKKQLSIILSSACTSMTII